MSDRAVFLPYRGETDCPWADVTIRAGASPDEIREAARAFVGMGGPHKVMVDRRNDPRFVEFRRILSDEWSMEPGYGGWEYSLYEAGTDITESVVEKS